MLYREDFEQERKDREMAHNLKEEMRLACDKALHEKTIEMEELQRNSEETIKKLRKKVEDTTEDLDQFKLIQGAQGIKSTTKQQQLRQQQDELTETRQQLTKVQQEIQAKTAQMKQYKKKDDQQEEKVTVSFVLNIIAHKPAN